MFRYIPGKYRDIPWYSGIFRDIPAYSVIFRHIPWYSGIPGFHNAPWTSVPWSVHESLHRKIHEESVMKRYHELFMNYSWIIHEMFMITRSWSIHEQQFSWTVPFNVHEKIHEQFMNIAHDLLFKNAWTLVHELFMNKKVHELNIIHELLLSWTVPFNVHAHSWRVHVLLMEVHEQNSWIFHE